MTSPLLPPQIEYDVIVLHEDEIEGALGTASACCSTTVVARSVVVRVGARCRRRSEIKKAYDYVVANRSNSQPSSPS
jgi:hypothetical protein